MKLATTLRYTSRTASIAVVRPLPRQLPRLAPATQFLPARNFTASPAAWKASVITYEELKPITKNPSDNILIMDVREPAEVMQGSIPSSVNVPLSTLDKALSMDDGDFTRAYGFKKPTKAQEIITTCKSGQRSQSALEALAKAGFKNVRNFKGSWTEWAAKEKKNPEATFVEDDDAGGAAGASGYGGNV